MKINIDEQSILSALLGNLAQRQGTLAWLYEQSGWRPWVSQHVRTNGGDEAQGEDVYV